MMARRTFLVAMAGRVDDPARNFAERYNTWIQLHNDAAQKGVISARAAAEWSEVEIAFQNLRKKVRQFYRGY